MPSSTTGVCDVAATRCERADANTELGSVTDGDDSVTAPSMAGASTFGDLTWITRGDPSSASMRGVLAATL